MAVLRAKRCSIHKFGSPNDEAIEGHRLYGKGLECYDAFEVHNSLWVAELECANRVHPYHRPERFDRLRHFIVTFHDSTLEFVCETVQASIEAGLPWPSLQRAILAESWR